VTVVPPAGVSSNEEASPSTSPVPVAAPTSVSCRPLLASASPSSAGVIVVPGAGATRAQVGAIVSTYRAAVADCRCTPPPGLVHTARSDWVPSGRVASAVIWPSGLAVMTPSETSPPPSLRNSSTAKPAVLATSIVAWKPGVAGSGSAPAPSTRSGA
jgi:hypothetical protein